MSHIQGSMASSWMGHRRASSASRMSWVPRASASPAYSSSSSCRAVRSASSKDPTTMRSRSAASSSATQNRCRPSNRCVAQMSLSSPSTSSACCLFFCSVSSRLVSSIRRFIAASPFRASARGPPPSPGLLTSPCRPTHSRFSSSSSSARWRMTTSRYCRISWGMSNWCSYSSSSICCRRSSSSYWIWLKATLEARTVLRFLARWISFAWVAARPPSCPTCRWYGPSSACSQPIPYRSVRRRFTSFFAMHLFRNKLMALPAKKRFSMSRISPTSVFSSRMYSIASSVAITLRVEASTFSTQPAPCLSNSACFRPRIFSRASSCCCCMAVRFLCSLLQSPSNGFSLAWICLS
mmetsp:Transcript_46538/g.83220  ORF Transcript_46538/g.83220 Transcript_46538/m.83220 type:complete len:351 (+) Transcript_46538:1043-2095(+)